MMTPIYNSMTPDFTPVIRMMELQTRLAMETTQTMMKLAMMPWAGMPQGFGSICTPMGSVTVSTAASVSEPAAPTEAETPTATAEIVEAEVVADPAPAAPDHAVEAPAPVQAAPVHEAPATDTDAPEADAQVKPPALSAPKDTPDDLTALNGVGPKLAEALNDLGIYHYAQIAAWSPENVAWVDENLGGVRGRASRDGWVAQAADLAK